MCLYLGRYGGTQLSFIETWVQGHFFFKQSVIEVAIAIANPLTNMLVNIFYVTE